MLQWLFLIVIQNIFEYFYNVYLKLYVIDG